MRVVLEGPDNAGKTTLSAILRDLPRVVYHHPGGKPADADAEMECMLEQLQLAQGQVNLVLDRVTCISQDVYNPDPGSTMANARARHRTYLQQIPNLVVVYCRPPNEVLMDVGNFTWRSEETEEHRQKIILNQHQFIERYDQLMQTVPCIFYNWRDEVHADIIRKALIRAMSGDESARKWFQGLINYRSAT
jgi:adenylate kinase family enzyme